jgi:hypothetical protein
MCTDAEAVTGTDETRYINSKQAKDNYGYTFIPSDTIIYSSDGEVSGAYTDYTKVKEVTAKATGTYRIYWEQASYDPNFTFTARCKIYKNDVGFGSEQTSTSQLPYYTEKHEDLAFAAGDKIQLYMKINGGSVAIKNFRIKVTIIPNTILPY